MRRAVALVLVLLVATTGATASAAMLCAGCGMVLAQAAMPCCPDASAPRCSLPAPTAPSALTTTRAEAPPPALLGAAPLVRAASSERPQPEGCRPIGRAGLAMRSILRL